MRFFVSLIVVSAFLLSFAAASFGENIGYIDVAKVFKQYKETAKAEEQLKKLKDEFDKQKNDMQAQLDNAEKSGTSKEALVAMAKDLDTKLDPKRQEILKLNDQLTTKLQSDILASVKKVAKKVGIDMVLDKAALIIGGTDLTDMVISDLNK